MDFLGLYDSLDTIGTGSFGIIRKVRRKSDGLLFARKELYFERMSERDRKQIVAEVNILKNLKHDHIVRYHDRYVDRDAGILYIVMEYCGGGDLSAIIKQAQKDNYLIPEDTIWRYFMQILLALNHCHHPHGHGRSRSLDEDSKERRTQVLHRDLKPDNIFLDGNNRIKLGDFGLAKALAQTNLTFTFVGTPYYMSPELMQEKAYDSKSDIWSLGCLIYELCALRPPFHEAEEYNELTLCVRNGRIPPLPRGYSQSLWAVIKSMLSINPAMRPSAAQLLQHERVDFALKSFEAEKMVSAARKREFAITARERELHTWESSLADRESKMAKLLSEKDTETASLRSRVSQLEQQVQHGSDVVEERVREELSKRDNELQLAIVKCEEEVAAVMARRERQILDVVKAREEEIFESWKAREEEIKSDMLETVREREVWIESRTEELRVKADALDGIRKELEIKLKTMDDSSGARKQRRQKSPLEEVRGILSPLNRRVCPDTGKRLPVLDQPLYSTHFDISVNPDGSHIPHGFISSMIQGIIMSPKGTISKATSPEPVGVLAQPSRVGLNLIKILDTKDGLPSWEEHPSIQSAPASIPTIEFPHPQASSIPETCPTGNPDSVSSFPTSADATEQTVSSTFSTSSCSTSSAHCRRLSNPSPEQIMPTSLSTTPRATPSLPHRNELRLGGESPRTRCSMTQCDGAPLATVTTNLTNVQADVT